MSADVASIFVSAVNDNPRYCVMRRKMTLTKFMTTI